jgi:hypothetical protein
MFEIPERLPKTKRSRPPERAKNHGERIELSVAPKVMECQPSHRQPPLFPLRPVEDDGTVAQIREDILLNVVAPDRTVGVDKENVAPPQAPPCPHHDMHACRRDGECEKCNDADSDQQWDERNDDNDMPPFRSSSHSPGICCHGIGQTPHSSSIVNSLFIVAIFRAVPPSPIARFTIVHNRLTPIPRAHQR